MSRTDKDRPYQIRKMDLSYTIPWWVRSFSSARGSNSLKNYINVKWNKPERNRERCELRKATQDYNANGETDFIFPNYQHRHRTQWYYW